MNAERNERIRDVIQAMLEKARTLNVAELNDLVDMILPRVSTNITTAEILSLVPIIVSVDITDSEGWPYEVREITLDRWYGVPVTLETNVEKMHKETLGQSDYAVSETVKEISNQIIKKTGYE